MGASFTTEFVARALGLPVPAPIEFQSITTDSRKADRGSLFVAIPGEKFDGHQFIAKAIEQGASGIVAEKGKLPPSLPKHVAVFEVNDTTEAYRKLGAAWRGHFSIPVIVVAGSVGKTTTKELLTAILRGKYARVVSTQGSQNGYLGIPMTLLDIRADTDVAVVEVGIDEIGAMEKHMAVVRPTASLMTSIGPEHLEKLIDVPTVAREESYALTLTAKTGGATIVRMDDPYQAKILPQLLFSQNAWQCALDADLHGPRSVKGQVLADGKHLRVTQESGSIFELTLPLPGKHNAANLLIAVACALSQGLNPIEIQRGLSQFQGAYGRSELRVLPRNTPVVCDYYNANPSSVEAGLDVLDQVSREMNAREKCAVLGDMLELGTQEEQLHRELSAKIMSLALDRVFLYGNRMKWLEDELKKRGFKGSVAHFGDHAALAQDLVSHFRLGDALLIKGSRGMRMEEVWKLVEPKLLQMGTA